MIGKKKVLKWIKEESAKLPDMWYEAYHKYSEPRVENVAKEGEEEDKQLITGYMQKHKVNHRRRIKRLWKNHGMKEVSNYFLFYGFALVEKEKGVE